MTDSDDKKVMTAMTVGVVLLNVLVFAAGYDDGNPQANKPRV